MATAMVRQEQTLTNDIEQVVIAGDLKALQPAQRVAYYNRVCSSLGLNPFTRPFDYITLNGKLTLYARRDAADQLRQIHGISLSNLQIEYTDDMVIVTIEATDRKGRSDSDVGAVAIAGLKGEARANAIMKAITKAKRRVTLSIAGLGWLDETEVDTVPGAQHVTVDTETGEIVDGKARPQQDPPTDEELELMELWKSPLDAQTWALQSGAYQSPEEARLAFKEVVDDFGGKLNQGNLRSVYLTFMRIADDLLEQLYAEDMKVPA